MIQLFGKIVIAATALIGCFSGYGKDQKLVSAADVSNTVYKVFKEKFPSQIDNAAPTIVSAYENSLTQQCDKAFISKAVASEILAKAIVDLLPFSIYDIDKTQDDNSENVARAIRRGITVYNVYDMATEDAIIESAGSVINYNPTQFILKNYPRWETQFYYNNKKRMIHDGIVQIGRCPVRTNTGGYKIMQGYTGKIFVHLTRDAEGHWDSSFETFGELDKKDEFYLPLYRFEKGKVADDYRTTLVAPTFFDALKWDGKESFQYDEDKAVIRNCRITAGGTIVECEDFPIEKYYTGSIYASYFYSNYNDNGKVFITTDGPLPQSKNLVCRKIYCFEDGIITGDFRKGLWAPYFDPDDEIKKWDETPYQPGEREGVITVLAGMDTKPGGYVSDITEFLALQNAINKVSNILYSRLARDYRPDVMICMRGWSCNRSNFDKAIRVALSRAKFCNIVYIGHGGKVIGKDKSNQASLALIDGDYKRDSFQEVLKDRKSKAECYIVIDACHSGGMFENFDTDKKIGYLTTCSKDNIGIISYDEFHREVYGTTLANGLWDAEYKIYNTRYRDVKKRCKTHLDDVEYPQYSEWYSLQPEEYRATNEKMPKPDIQDDFFGGFDRDRLAFSDE